MTTYYPLGSMACCCGGSSAVSTTSPSTFAAGDLSSGTITIAYANIAQAPPDVTIFDSENRQIVPANVTDLTPGLLTGQVLIDLANVAFSGTCRIKIT
jgi:hypothetical protein